MRVKRMPGAALVLCGVALTVAGCQRATIEPEPPAIPYHLVDVTTHIDRKTGNIVRVALWDYDDGYVTTTTDAFPPGSADDDRRSGQPPGPGVRYAP